MDLLRSDLARFRGTAAMALALVVMLTTSAAACPSCREALASDAGGGDLVSGFFWSILFLLAMPFTLLTLFLLYCYWLVRKARLANQG
jgi:hypothetical protein